MIAMPAPATRRPWAGLVDTPAVLIDVDIVLIRGNQFARYERVAVPGEGSLEYP